MWRFIYSKISLFFLALGMVFWTALPETLACPVCYTAASDSRIGYYGTTIGMTLIPFVLFGGLFWWVRRNYFNK